MGMDSGSVVVDGFDSVTVGIGVSMNLGSRVAPCDPADIYNRFAGKPVVTLTRTTGASGVQYDDVALVPLTDWPGGNRDATFGVWLGDWRVTSARAGIWTVTGLSVCTDAHGGPGWRIDPRTVGMTLTLTVTGTNIPSISVGTTTAVHGSSAITARVILRDGAGQPIVGRQVAFGADNTCGADADSGTLVATGAGGLATRTMDPRLVMCVYVTSPPASSIRLDDTEALVYKRFFTPKLTFRSVGALPSTTSIARNAVLTFTGSISPTSGTLGYPVTATIYRQIGPNSYRSVGSAAARSSGRYTVTTRPQSRGYFYYKVVATSDRPGMVPTASPGTWCA